MQAVLLQMLLYNRDVLLNMAKVGSAHSDLALRVHGWDLFIEKLFPYHLCLLSQDTTEPFKNRGEYHTCARKRKII